MTDTPRPTPAHHLTIGKGPPVLFLPGYASDMAGSKALALEAWAQAVGRTFLRFDYAGCGASAGDFEEQTLTGWRDDALAMLDLFSEPAILVGSSMGGWIALMIARDHPELVAGLIGIAPAPDFTDWGFSTDEKMAMLQNGRIERASPYSDQPTVYTARFWQSGEASRMTAGTIAVDCPVRLIHGLNDGDVPSERTMHLLRQLRSADVQASFVKGGDHRLSRDGDIALLIRTVEGIA
ncbi:alpha/beta hydrolase [Sphingomonas sp.]|jgi:pimeloyl-ACP methyl ester carboxylesterase|uniref:alpha/beta hydrolase n=1 Tax=Sphingomonas sp. TaxID=28214 RepID=UPI002E338E76|nr:alpha/beta fold hydrolase [Sphingomonas sp.]HEX4693277.1 alpha/beta fold hydrolase [Sphingomonas sp.]